MMYINIIIALMAVLACIGIGVAIWAGTLESKCEKKDDYIELLEAEVRKLRSETEANKDEIYILKCKNAYEMNTENKVAVES